MTKSSLAAVRVLAFVTSLPMYVASHFSGTSYVFLDLKHRDRYLLLLGGASKLVYSNVHLEFMDTLPFSRTKSKCRKSKRMPKINSANADKFNKCRPTLVTTYKMEKLSRQQRLHAFRLNYFSFLTISFVSNYLLWSAR